MDYDGSSAEQRDEFLRKFKLIKSRTVQYDKPIAIIYNPNSGKKTNLVPII